MWPCGLENYLLLKTCRLFYHKAYVLSMLCSTTENIVAYWSQPYALDRKIIALLSQMVDYHIMNWHLIKKELLSWYKVLKENQFINSTSGA